MGTDRDKNDKKEVREERKVILRESRYKGKKACDKRRK